MQHLQPNSTLQGGKYKIEKVLGQGGFGITYLAEQVMLGRKVAVKEFFMKELCDRDKATRTMYGITSYGGEISKRYKNKFLKEARIIKGLDHPNIVKVEDVFEENGTAYYVMDYIEGYSLADVVKRQRNLSETKALKYFGDVADALGYVHSKRINHLDVKPTNIMIHKNDDKAILIDFGVSKQYDSVGSQTSSTPVGISAGFAPLEQHVVGGVSSFSPRTDIYALGATLYYMVVGKNPPTANDILNLGIPALPNNLSETIKNVIKSAMQARQDDKPETIEDLLVIANKFKEVYHFKYNIEYEAHLLKKELEEDPEVPSFKYLLLLQLAAVVYVASKSGGGVVDIIFSMLICFILSFVPLFVIAYIYARFYCNCINTKKDRIRK